jgi:hypothetical protein
MGVETFMRIKPLSSISQERIKILCQNALSCVSIQLNGYCIIGVHGSSLSGLYTSFRTACPG